jgi:Spy/CpxP family protein refolding chaperone
MKSIRNAVSATLLAAGAVLSAGAVAASAADLSTAASPPPGAPGPHGWHHHRGPWHMLGQLGLSAEQKEQIKGIMTAARPQMQSLREQAMAQKAEMRAQVLKVLTPAQQTQLTALEAQMRATKHGAWNGPPPSS